MVKILIVDDQAIDREYYGAVLERAGYELLKAANGAEALELAREHRPDVVLADLLMPVLDGYGLVKAIRADARLARTRVVFCTATYLNPQARELAAALGVAHFLVKPIARQTLNSVIEEVLRAGMGEAPSPDVPRAEVESLHLELLNDLLLSKTAKLEEEAATRHQVEAKLRQHHEELADVQKELQAFTHAASHDLKGPLGRIGNFSTLLGERYRDRLEGDGLMFLDVIQQNALRLHALMADMQAHVQLGQQAQGSWAIDASAAIQAVLHEQAGRARKDGVEIRLDLAPGLRARSHPNVLILVLHNLIDNALKYSGQAASPLVEIGGREEAGACLLWIRDNGIGIDKTYHDRIFEIFQRLHTYSEYPGTGVGLSIVRKAMERMGGRVWVESEPGQGATFFLRFPVEPAEEAGPGR